MGKKGDRKGGNFHLGMDFLVPQSGPQQSPINLHRGDEVFKKKKKGGKKFFFERFLNSQKKGGGTLVGGERQKKRLKKRCPPCLRTAEKTGMNKGGGKMSGV